MKHLIPILLLFTLSPFHHLTVSAAVPLRWTVETSRAQPATFDEFAGATYDLEATLLSYGKPLAVVGVPRLYWQTNGMGSAYWSAPASVSGNDLRATWTPACDVGARAYNCFIGITGTVYNAAFQLRLRPSPGAVPNELPLPLKVIDFSRVTVLNPPWPAGSARQLPKYIHVMDFDDSFPDDAAWYYAQHHDYGGCSSVRYGNFLSRNYDWDFDDMAEFVVRMSAGPDRCASVGVANAGPKLTEAIVTSGTWSRYYKALPGHTVDGINEHGIACNVNVVATNGMERWRGDPATGVHCLGAVRWVLDHATNAAHAAQYLADHVYVPSGWTQNFHYMIADERDTYIVENGEVADRADPVTRRVLTNFIVSDDRFPGEGKERYQFLQETGGSITNVWYTRAYSRLTDPAWMSDFGYNTALYNAALDLWNDGRTKEQHRGENRGGQHWWQTVHTSIYDLKQRVLRIAVQETDDWYVFACPPADPSGAIKALSDKLQDKRDITDRTFVTYAPGDWSPSVVDGVWYSPQYYGDGWSVEKYSWYDEWGEWYWEDSEWIYGPGEDAMTLVAHKLWSDEEITLTRARVPVEDNLALESQVGSVAQSAAREYLNGNDLVKWKKVLRTGLPGQWGTGWGNVHYEFASDRRWWTMKVPDFTATVTAGGHVDSNGNDVVSSSITIGGRSYVTDPMRRITRSPVKILMQTDGTNGTERCASAEWNAAFVPTGGQTAVDDPDSCAYAIGFSLDYQEGLGDVSVLPRRLLPPVIYNDGYSYSTVYTMSDFVAEVESATNRSATVRCRYACSAKYSGYNPVSYTNWFTVAISAPSGAYTEMTKEYERVITSNTRSLFWDPSLHVTWRIDVTNGCFFSEIVSTNNLTGVR